MKNPIKKFVSKRGALLTAGALAAGAASYGVTSAYFAGSEGTTNTFYVANNTITVHEDFPTPDPMGEGENLYKKDVKIKNTGKVECFVRVFVDFSDDDVRTRSQLSPNGTDYYSFDDFKTHLPNNWVYGGDNYFYYTQALPAGATTPSLFKNVKTTFESADAVEDYDLIVYAESIQTHKRDGSPITGSDAYRTAWTEYLSN